MSYTMTSFGQLELTTEERYQKLVCDSHGGLYNLITHTCDYTKECNEQGKRWTGRVGPTGVPVCEYGPELTAAERYQELVCRSHGGVYSRAGRFCDYTKECEEQGKTWSKKTLPNGTPICEDGQAPGPTPGPAPGPAPGPGPAPPAAGGRVAGIGIWPLALGALAIGLGALVLTRPKTRPTPNRRRS